MTKITTVYKTDDGETFDTLTEAENHQVKVDLWEQITERFGTYGSVEINYLEDFIAIMNFYEENK